MLEGEESHGPKSIMKEGPPSMMWLYPDYSHAQAEKVCARLMCSGKGWLDWAAAGEPVEPPAKKARQLPGLVRAKRNGEEDRIVREVPTWLLTGGKLFCERQVKPCTALLCMDCWGHVCFRQDKADLKEQF